MPQSRDIRKLLEARAAALEDEDGGTVTFDPAGPALYRYGGKSSPLTIVACFPCQHVALVTSIPARPAIVWTCPAGHHYRLEPPLDVLAFGRPVARA